MIDYQLIDNLSLQRDLEDENSDCIHLQSTTEN